MPTDELLAGRYRRIRPLGRGAMGEVWLAEDVLLHRTVAIKQLLTAHRQDKTSASRVVREARVAARLSHPNIVAVYDLLDVDDQPFVVMEYVPGVSLADEIHDTGRLPPSRVARIIAQIAAALATAHQAGVAHRDIKPANILLPSAEGAGAKLADFGIARAATDVSLTGTGLLVGTPAYLAPEVARGAEPGAASDVWALGATMYAAVEGRAPFVRGEDENALAVLSRAAVEPVPVATSAGPMWPLLDRMLSRDPAARPAAGQVHRQLSSLMSAGPSASVHATAELSERVAAAAQRREPPGRTEMLAPVRRRRVRVIVGVAVVAVLVVAGVLAAVWPRGGHRASGTSTPPPTVSASSASRAASSSAGTGSAPRSTASTASTDPMNTATMTRFVQQYYSLLPHDLATAWTLLGPGLQAQGRAAYANWWSRFDSVQVTPVAADAARRTVTIRLSAHNATTGRTSSDTEVLTLVRTPAHTGLLIDASAVE